MDYEPESGWDAINEKSPAVYRYAQWAQARIKELEANERFDLDAFYDEMQAKEDRIKELEEEDRVKYLGLIDENDRLKRVVEAMRRIASGEVLGPMSFARRTLADYDEEA